MIDITLLFLSHMPAKINNDKISHLVSRMPSKELVTKKFLTAHTLIGIFEFIAALLPIFRNFDGKIIVFDHLHNLI